MNDLEHLAAHVSNLTETIIKLEAKVQALEENNPLPYTLPTSPKPFDDTGIKE